jgi:hypothetical protein
VVGCIGAVGASVVKEENDDREGRGQDDADVLADDRVGERNGDLGASARDVCVLRRIGDDGVGACSASPDMCLMTSDISFSVQACM